MDLKRLDGDNEVGLYRNWGVKEDVNDDACDSTSIGSISEDSMDSECSSSSSEMAEEASSSSSSQSNGPLFELSELMTHLPIKRGLSMFYQGKAQSFTSLSRVQSLEDLPKKSKPYRKKMKSCKSYGGGLDSHKISYIPKATATISKKASRGSVLSSMHRRGSFMAMPRPPSLAATAENTFEIQTS